MHPFEPFAGNVTSQSGEDGMLAEIFRRIGAARRSCVEFGAWDGKYLSNTWSLWHEQGWSALLIEGHAERHAALAGSLADYPQARALCAYVQPEGENSLDSLLERGGLECEFDLLSIDVDGDDFHIWRGLEQFRPRVVVVEYNPTIPPEIELVQRRGEYFGASARSLATLAAAKDYRLAACTKTNCIFVDAAHWAALGIGEVRLEDAQFRGHLTYVLSAYDGRNYLSRMPTFTYTTQPPLLAPSVLLEEARASLKFDPARAGRPAEPEGALMPVKIFGYPEQAPRGSLAARILRRLWLVLMRTGPGLRAQAVRGKWRQWRQDRAAIAAWERQGRPVPPPHAYKQRVVREYARRHGVRVLVETGTYLGEMVNAMRRAFGQVYSIELDQELYRRAAQRFLPCSNVAIVQGDSGRVLPGVLDKLAGPGLFWLDGHYSADITARGDKDTPIAAELASIARHPDKRHVILIDDARCFNGSHDYPTLKELEAIARQYWPGSSFEVRDDIVRIAPAR